MSTADSPSKDTKTARPRRLIISILSLFTVALLAAIAVGVANLQRDGDMKELRQRLDRVSLKDSAMAADARTANPHMTLISADRTNEVNAVLISKTSGFVVTAKLPALEKTKTYQLWATSNAQQISVGILGQSFKQAAFTMPEGTTELRVTVEAATGATQPTTPAVVTGTVPALSFE